MEMTHYKNKINYGNQVEEPWVFGLILQFIKAIRFRIKQEYKIFTRNKHPFLYNEYLFRVRFCLVKCTCFMFFLLLKGIFKQFL